jgi:hypothetical protein
MPRFIEDFMPVAVQWDNPEKTIIRYDLTGRWTWDEFFATYAEASGMLASVEHTVNFIVNPLDYLSQGYLPAGTLQKTIGLYRNGPPNTGITIVVGAGSFFRSLHGISQRIYPKAAARYKFAISIEEARSMLIPEKPR